VRLRAHTVSGRRSREIELNTALEFARYQGATLFELRCLLDYFELLGDGDRSELADAIRRFPGDTRWPERARAERVLS